MRKRNEKYQLFLEDNSGEDTPTASEPESPTRRQRLGKAIGNALENFEGGYGAARMGWTVPPRKEDE